MIAVNKDEQENGSEELTGEVEHNLWMSKGATLTPTALLAGFKI